MTCWALATGASRGVGLALARGLARAGCNIILSSRTPRRLEAARREIEALGVEAVAVAADLRVEESVDTLVDRALEASGGGIRAAVLSYGNPLCEPSTLDEAPYSCWSEAARLYLASTARIVSRLARESREERVTVAAVSSFTARQPHQPLAVADAVRRGLDTILLLAAKRWPGKIQAVLLVLGSFPTPGAAETVRLVAGDRPLDEYWREKVEPLSPLGRAGGLDELERVAQALLELPGYAAYTPLYLEGASLGCP